MTRVEFFDLAQRVSVYAREHPRRYRIKVTLLALLGYGVIFGLIALCAAVLVLGGWGFTQEWFWETAGRSGHLVVLGAAALVSAAATLFGLVRSLFVKIPPPSGRRVQRGDAPALFAMIDEVVAASQAPHPHTVLLTWDFNAAVSQQPRFGWFGWTRDFLILGVPLMGAMTPEQFKAVLAHEFGHLRGGHARFQNRIYRLRTVWGQTQERLARQRQRVAMLVARFLRWYAPRFNAYTFALARAEEFEADRWAAQVAGLPATGEAFVNLWTRGLQMQEHFWQPVNQRACHEPDVPHGVFASMFPLLRRMPSREDWRRWLRVTLGRVTEGTGTHPSPAERLAALGLPATLDELASETMWSEDAGGEAADAPSAATVLLAPRLDEFVGELETSWRVAAAAAWRQRYERATAVRARLYALERERTVRPDGELPEDLAWERTRLEKEGAATPAEARAAAERFVARWPAHAAGRFLLGQLLLQEDDETGVVHLEEATRLDGRLTSGREEALAAYLRRAGQDEAAAARRRLAVSHGDVLDAARAERQTVVPRDRLLPHGLDEPEVAKIREYLARHPRLWKAWLARKEVRHHPEQPWYVLVCVYKRRWNETGAALGIPETLRKIAAELQIAGRSEFWYLLLDHRRRRHPVARKIRRVQGAEIYPVPLPKGRRTWWGGRRPPATAALTPPPIPALMVPPPPTPVNSGLPPPLPPLRGAAPRRTPLLPVAAAVLAVLCPFAYVGYTVFRPGGSWEHIAGRVRQAFAGRNRMMAEATAPIPRDPQATTAEADRRATLAWARRTMLGGYDRSGKHNGRWNAPARAFIERALPWWAGVHGDPVTPAELLPQARAVLNLGCDDPLVLYLAGLVEERTDRQSPGRESALHARAARVRDRAVPARGRDGGGGRVGGGLWPPPRRHRRERARQAVVAAVVQGNRLVTGVSRPGSRRCWPAACCKARVLGCSRKIATPAARSSRRPGTARSRPWLGRCLSGRRHLDDAWKARGGDYASKVTREGWRGFEAGWRRRVPTSSPPGSSTPAARSRVADDFRVPRAKRARHRRPRGRGSTGRCARRSTTRRPTASSAPCCSRSGAAASKPCGRSGKRARTPPIMTPTCRSR